MLRIVCTTVALLLSGVSLLTAQTFPLLHGQTGTPHVSYPSSIGKGGFVVAVGTAYTDFGKATDDPRGETGDFSVNATLGVMKDVDVSVFLRYAAVNVGNEGFARAGVGLKLPIFSSEQLALGVQGELMPSFGNPDPLVSSGKLNYQIHALASYRLSAYRVYAELGFGKLDFADGQMQTLSAEPTLTGAVSILAEISPRADLFVELVGARVTSKADEDLFAHVGTIVRVGKKLELLGGGGIGLPNRTVANTDLRATLGLRYFNAKD